MSKRRTHGKLRKLRYSDRMRRELRNRRRGREHGTCTCTRSVEVAQDSRVLLARFMARQVKTMRFKSEACPVHGYQV